MDEKLLTAEQAKSCKNYRSWATEAPGTSVIIEHHQIPQSVMAWRGIFVSSMTPPVFVEQRVKNDEEVNQRDSVENMVHPWTQQDFGDAEWTYQQDSAPVHRAETTQECKVHFLGFITSAECPLYSLDLDPMSYRL